MVSVLKQKSEDFMHFEAKMQFSTIYLFRGQRVSSAHHCVNSSTFVITLWSLTPRQWCSPLFLSLNVCLPVPLDSDPEVRHSANCFIRTHAKQTHQTGTMWGQTSALRDPLWLCCMQWMGETAVWVLQPYVYMCIYRFIAINVACIDNELIIATFWLFQISY